MRIITWNVRGLGGYEKKQEVRNLINEKKPSIICLQETKLSVIDDFIGAALWGTLTQSYSYRPSVGASGGLLVMWDPSVVEIWTSSSKEHVLIVHGRFILSGEEFIC
jgi:hypothetical protein